MTTPTTPPGPPERALARNVLVLGAVSLCADIGSEMVFPLLPVFLTTVVGGGALALAWVEGIAEAVAAAVRFWSGAWSDRLGRCRPFVITGYAIAALSRPLFALAAAPWHVAAARAFDRTGKGLRSTPRDALLASSVPPQRRAWAFGLHRSMDHLGAAIGSVLAFAILTLWTDDLRTLFLCAAIPGLAATAIAWGFVRELPPGVQTAGKPKKERDHAALRRFLVPFAIFSFGSAGDEFLLLRLGGTRETWAQLPLLWMALHIIRSALAAPCGRIADRVGTRRMLLVGWCLHTAVFLGFAVIDVRAGLIALFMIHGARTAMTEGAEKALVAELAAVGSRGSAFAWYYLVIAITPRLLFGGLWEFIDVDVAFTSAAGISLVATILLALRRT